MLLMFLLVGLVIVGLLLALYLVFLSRHKKSATGTLDLIGATGVVHATLNPEGAVVVNGDLWRARVSHGSIGPGKPIRVLGIDGLLLLVEAA
jgi:membrane-bound serine protease (ClpP class)